MSVRIETNSANLEAYLRECANRQPEILQQWRSEGKQLVMEEMRARIPIGKTGLMRESVTGVDTPDGFMVYPAHPAAEFVERGTRPHDIYPKGYTVTPAKGFIGQLFFKKGGGVLHWKNEWGADIFAKHVHHPGFMGRHFVAQTLETVKIELQRLYQEILERVLG